MRKTQTANWIVYLNRVAPGYERSYRMACRRHRLYVWRNERSKWIQNDWERCETRNADIFGSGEGGAGTGPGEVNRTL